jgi:hypothetical protein
MYKKGEIVDPNLEHEAYLDVAKQRNGPTGEIPLTYLPECMRFENHAGGGFREPPRPVGEEETDDLPE